MANLTKEDFVEFSYEAIKEETKLHIKFQSALTTLAQPRIFSLFDEDFDFNSYGNVDSLDKLPPTPPSDELIN